MCSVAELPVYIQCFCTVLLTGLPRFFELEKMYGDSVLWQHAEPYLYHTQNSFKQKFTMLAVKGGGRE